MNKIALPSLSAFQSFEAAARLGSFSRAAKERNLTHSAVSRNIQAMEHWCGEVLFVRHGPKVLLSEAGERLRDRLGEPLRALYQALDLAPSHMVEQKLKIYMLLSIAATWLIPNLSSFAEAFPNVVLSVETNYDMISLPPNQPAVAIRFGHFDKTGLTCQRLWFDRMVAVASPNWATKHGKRPENWNGRDMLRHTHESWPRRVSAGSSRTTIKFPEATGYEFNDAMLLAQAALHGMGVAWLRESLVSSLLEDGRLVELHQSEQASDKSCWLVCREDMSATSQIRNFFEWCGQSVAAMTFHSPSRKKRFTTKYSSAEGK